MVITSVGGKVPTPRLLPYTAAKFATVGFAESLRTEARRDGIWLADPVLIRSAGEHHLHARATDSAGHTQPEQATPNPGGYGNNSIHRVRIDAR